MPASKTPPVAQRIDKALTKHEHTRSDPYFWLRDDSRSAPEVLEYLRAENAYTKTMLQHTEPLQEELYGEMTGRLEPNKDSVPVFENGYWYQSRFTQGKDYQVHARRPKTLDAPEEVLIDENLRAEGHSYYRLNNLEISPDGKLMAISEDTISRRLYEIRVKNLETGEIMEEVIEQTSGDLAWANDNRHFYYVRKDPQTLLPFQVFRHKLGTPSSVDVLIYQEHDDTFYTSLMKTRSKRFIGIVVSSTTNSETLLLDADNNDSEPVPFLPREANHLYEIDHIGNRFFINSDFQAPNGKLCVVEDTKIGSREHWTEILAHQDSVLVQDFDLFETFLATNERENGLELLRIRQLNGRLIDTIEIQEKAYTTGLDANPETATRKLRYFVSSMTTPMSVFEYDVDAKISKLLKRDRVPGDFKPEDYASERRMMQARDGVQIPVSLVYHKEHFKKNGENPLLLYAYGSYGITVDPSFNVSRLSLLDRGFVYAIAHVRGGKMLGRTWYEQGKLMYKINTFNDFIDVTRGLIRENYAHPEKVYAMGGSAGGLLMGGLVNMAPELYNGIIAEVPFVDVISTMLDESIPLTTGEYDEWGNPNEEPAYRYMLSYSPYDQVQDQVQPHLLVTTGLHDSQVQYWEPAKWVAKLRHHKKDDHLLLLDIDMEAGHGGKSGRYKAYLDLAKIYAFLLDIEKISSQKTEQTSADKKD